MVCICIARAQVGVETFCATHSVGTACVTSECPGFRAYCQAYQSPIGNRCVCGIFSSTPDTSLPVCTSDGNMCVWGTSSAGVCSANGPTIICWPSTDQCKRSECRQSTNLGCQLVHVPDFSACTMSPCQSAHCYQGTCMCDANLPTQPPSHTSSHTPSQSISIAPTSSISISQIPENTNTRTISSTPGPSKSTKRSVSASASASTHPTTLNQTHSSHHQTAIMVSITLATVFVVCLMGVCVFSIIVILIGTYLWQMQKNRATAPLRHKSLLDDDDDNGKDTSTDNNEF